MATEFQMNEPAANEIGREKHRCPFSLSVGRRLARVIHAQPRSPVTLAAGQSAMRYQRPEIIVKIAAMISGLLALGALAILVFLAARLILHDADSPQLYRMLGFCGLLAIVPLMFIWAAVQSWRCIPRGVVSLSSGWILLGLGGGIFSLFWFFTDWKAKDALVAVLWTCIFLFGVLVARQGKRIGLRQ